MTEEQSKQYKQAVQRMKDEVLAAANGATARTSNGKASSTSTTMTGRRRGRGNAEDATPDGGPGDDMSAGSRRGMRGSRRSSLQNDTEDADSALEGGSISGLGMEKSSRSRGSTPGGGGADDTDEGVSTGKPQTMSVPADGVATAALVKKLGSQRINNIFTHLRKIAQHPLLVRHMYDDDKVSAMAAVACRHKLFGGICTMQRVSQELAGMSSLSTHQTSHVFNTVLSTKACCKIMSLLPVSMTRHPVPHCLTRSIKSQCQQHGMSPTFACAGYSDYQLHSFALAHPQQLGQYVLDDSAVMSSGKLVALDGLLDQLQQNGSRPLIFSQWTSVLDIIEWFLHMKGLSFVRLDGSTAVSTVHWRCECLVYPGVSL